MTIADQHRKETRGELGPKVRVDAYIQQWTEPYNIPFALTPGQPPANFPVHDATVWNFTVTATQPITGLLPIYDTYKVRELGVDVAAVRKDAQQRNIALQVTANYYHLLQAEKLSEVARASVDQLTQQLKQSTSFHDNGTVSLDDVLRAKLAVANAEQRSIQTRARVTIERARLATLMGMSPDSDVSVIPRGTEAPPMRDAVSLEQAESRAESARPELVEIDRRIEQAHLDVRIAQLKLLPQVNLVGAYIHNDGSLFSQQSSAYVGGTASWDVWDWGTNYAGIGVQKAMARQAALARSKIDDQIKLEVREAYVNVASASEAVAVAHASVDAAEENFRLVKKRYEANAATSFDVVDSEAQLTQARGQLQTSLYDLLVARASLRRAMGAPAESLADE